MAELRLEVVHFVVSMVEEVGNKVLVVDKQLVVVDTQQWEDNIRGVRDGDDDGETY